jgi:hypothetical protein
LANYQSTYLRAGIFGSPRIGSPDREQPHTSILEHSLYSSTQLRESEELAKEKWTTLGGGLLNFPFILKIIAKSLLHIQQYFNLRKMTLMIDKN